MFGMNLALVSNNIGLMWVAVELATLSTVVMVGIYRTHEALEAAWKYFILGSVGIALALFGTILVYLAARPVVGGGLNGMAWTVLLAHANGFDPALLDIAFIFLLLGYGTKVGLAPMHAWLPDAHAEGPTPISAVLSGLLLNVALYALLRFKMLLVACPGGIAPGPLMIALGLVSLLFASVMLYRRRDIKRLFAYSSIEHMGIIVFAFGMAGPLGNFAGLLQMTMHSLTKSAIFFSVGHVAQVKGTQRIAEMGGLTESHPVLGWALVAGVAAIAGLPPFGVFTSEFLVVSSTFAREPRAGGAAGAWPPAGARRAAAARLVDGVRAGARADGTGARVLHSDVRAPRAGADRGNLSAGAAGGVVPARRGAARMSAWEEAAATRSPSGSATLLSLWGEPDRAHLALLQEGAIRHVRHRLPRWPLSVDRAAASGGDPAGTGGARPLWAGACRPARYPALARPRRGPDRLSVPARGRRASASGSGRARACRHHRAGPFPVHLRRRDRGAAGTAARLRASRESSG